jgi:hypothetical protein
MSYQAKPLSQILFRDEYWQGQMSGRAEALKHARAMYESGTLTRRELQDFEADCIAQLPEAMDMEAYARARRKPDEHTPSDLELMDSARAKDAAEQQRREAVGRKIALDFVTVAVAEDRITAKEARAYVKSITTDDPNDSDEDALGKAMLANISEEPLKPAEREKPAYLRNEIKTVSEAEAAAIRERVGGGHHERERALANDRREYERIYGTREKPAEGRKSKHELGTDGRGVMSSEDAAALDQAESGD